MTASHADLIACAERELARRIRAFPRAVEANRMSKEMADAELALQRQIVGFLKANAPGAAPIPQRELFPGRKGT